MAHMVTKTVKNTMLKAVMALSHYNRSRRKAPNRPHPYLTGIHEPMKDEHTLGNLQVTGAIPSALDGRYMRIGPNPVTEENPADYHWFAGEGMGHAIRIKDGQALWYHNRWMRSNAVSDALGEQAKPGRRSRSDIANTNIIQHAGRTYAIVEAGGLPVELDNGLETIAHNPFDETLDVSFSAHPHLDPKTGELHAICYDAPVMDKIWHVIVDAHGKVRKQDPIKVMHGPSIHDCAITDNFILVFDLPVTFSMKEFLAGARFPYAWNDNHRARVGLCPRDGSSADTLWHDVDPCYVFHPANAYEQDGTVIVDVVAHESMFKTSKFGPDSPKSRLERWTMDINGGAKVERKVLHDRNQEFPRFNEQMTCKEHRYIYSIALISNAIGDDMIEMNVEDIYLFKHDVVEGTVQTRDFGSGCHPGEFIFIPRHEHVQNEDDGWLMGLVIDMNEQTSALYILNADDFMGEAQAIIHIPHRIPPGFHGNWARAV